MKRFNFRLQRVLNFRTTEKKDRERELALRNRELQNAEERLLNIVDAHDSVERPEERQISMAELNLTGNYQQLLHEALVKQRLLVLEASYAVDAAREAYLEKAIETEMLETLRNRRLDEHKTDQKRANRKELDQLTVQRHPLNKKVSTPEDEGESNG